MAVTMLTSFAEDALPQIGMTGPIAQQVARLAALAQSAGLEGVVASPHEVQLIRRQAGASFVIVTPGIRGVGDAKGDQSRTLSAAEALAAGSTYLVVGRPILAASDPRAAAERIAQECRAARTP
jgi:orotidine-5'-phosphate decarboxylase